ncbi:MAG: rRNA maturation RNase YbeY [Acidobacteria bacterium]|nr:rRNA maturation RNase YbeY [Acidobacteriota bacterium]
MGKRSSILFRKTLPKEERSALRAFAEEVAVQVLEGKSFDCLISNDKQLHALNLQFLGADYPTDVLSFPSGEEENLGELAISIERAAEQAATHGHSLLDELKILMLHGALHLKGMDHETDRGQMRRVETRWRKVFGLSAGLIERTR